MRKAENGNVIFIILIAVALFAALGFAVSSGRGGSKDILAAEEAVLAATEIVQYAEAVKLIVKRMHMLGRVDEQSFCFDSPQWPSGNSYRYDDQETCSNTANKVFDTASGGVHFQTPEADWFDPAALSWMPSTHLESYGHWLYTGNHAVLGVGTTAAELSMYLGPIRREICVEINKRLGLPTDPVPADYVGEGKHADMHFGAYGTFYPNNYDITTAWIGDDDGTPTALEGKRTGCGMNTVSVPGYTIYYFYTVLVTR